MNDLDAELFRAFLNGQVGALHRDWRQEDAVGQIFESVVISANPDLSFDAVVIGLHIRVAERPVFACAIVPLAFEIAFAEPKRHRVPKLSLTTQPAAPFAIHARLARLHGRNVAKRKFPGKAVCIEVGSGIDLWATLEHKDIGPQIGQPSRQGASARARPDDDHVV